MTDQHDTPDPARRDPEPTQLDRIEAKVNQLEQLVDQLQQRRAADRSSTPNTPGRA